MPMCHKKPGQIVLPPLSRPDMLVHGGSVTPGQSRRRSRTESIAAAGIGLVLLGIAAGSVLLYLRLMGKI